MNFTFLELVFLVPIFLICIGMLIRNWRQGAMSIWAPTSLISLLYLYYAVIGPIYFVATKNTYFLGIDYRELFWKGWLASLLSLLCVGVGYLSYRGRKNYIRQICSDELLQKFALVLFGISFVAIIYSLASMNQLAGAFNPLASQDAALETSEYTTFHFAGFWVNLINLSIPAAVLSLLMWRQRRTTYSLVVLIVVTGLSTAYFVKTGFRFRIAWLAIASTGAYYLWVRRRPNPLWLGGGAVLFVAGLGLIGLTRQYYTGLSLDKAKGASFSDYVDKGFSEAGTFFSLCSVLDAVPARIPHTHWDPIWITVTLPVPRALWSGKPTSKTLEAIGRSFGAIGGEEAGQAISFYGEWYVAWGWPGLVISSFIFGWLCKRLWVWYLQRREDKLVILSYTVTLGFLYFVFSRGYTPLMVMNFIFGILPFFMFYGWLRRKAFLRALQRFIRVQQAAELAERTRQRRLARAGGPKT